MPNVTNADLRLLRVFATIVECQGFSTAQAELNISQSTISNHMFALEERLKCKLCQRGRAGFVLTEEGRIVYEAAQRLFAAVEDFRTDTEALRGSLVGELRIGVVDNTVTNSKSPISAGIRRFNARPNSVHISLVIDSPQGLQRHLLDHRVDIAIFGFAQKLPTLRYDKLYIEHHTLYCGVGHPLFGHKPSSISLDELHKHNFVARGYWNGQDLSRLEIPHAAASVNHMEAQLLLILSGGYLGFLPAHYARQWVTERRLEPVLEAELSYSAQIQLVMRKGVRLTAVVKTFIQDLWSCCDFVPPMASQTPEAAALAASPPRSVMAYAARGRQRFSLGPRPGKIPA